MQSKKPTKIELMIMHIEALYCFDEQFDLLRVNDWRPRSAPRFFLGRTQSGHVWRFRHDVSIRTRSKLARLCQKEPKNTDPAPRYRDEYRKILAEDQTITEEWLGPAYWFDQPAASIKPASQPSGICAVREANKHLLTDLMADWLADVPHQQPFVAKVVENQAVSVCASVRITAKAHEPGVETLTAHQRHGYASEVVIAWAEAVQTIGAIALYSTSVENSASQSLAKRLELNQYGMDFHVM